MADPGAVPLGGSLVSPPVATKEEEEDIDDASRRNPSRVARDETGEAHPPSLGGGSTTAGIGPLNADLGKDEAVNAEEDQSAKALTLLSIQGSDKTYNNTNNNNNNEDDEDEDEDAGSAGSLHDKPGSHGGGGRRCSSHKGKAVAVTETSPLTLVSSGAVAAGARQPIQDITVSRIEEASTATESPLPSLPGNSSQQQQQPVPQQEHEGKGHYGPSTPGPDRGPGPGPSSLYPNTTRTSEEEEGSEGEHSPIVSQLPPSPLPQTIVAATAAAAPFQPLQVGDPGWEKSADRPPKKLPVQFKDAIGRAFVFPWEIAKTWDVR